MKKISHFLRQLNSGLLKKNFGLKTICSLIFPKCLVVLRRECVWEKGEVVLTNFTIHITLCLIFNYRTPPFWNWRIGGEFSEGIRAAWSTSTDWLLWVSREINFFFFVSHSLVTTVEVLTTSFIFIIWHHLIMMPRRQGM